MRVYFAVQIDNNQLQNKNKESLEKVLNDELNQKATVEVASYDKKHRNAINLAKSLPDNPDKPNTILFSARVPEGKYFQSEPKAKTESVAVADLTVDIARFYQNGHYNRRVGKRISGLKWKPDGTASTSTSRFTKLTSNKNLMLAGALLLGLGAIGLGLSFAMLIQVSFNVQLALGATGALGLLLLGRGYFASKQATNHMPQATEDTGLLASLKEKIGMGHRPDLSLAHESVLSLSGVAAPLLVDRQQKVESPRTPDKMVEAKRHLTENRF